MNWFPAAMVVSLCLSLYLGWSIGYSQGRRVGVAVGRYQQVKESEMVTASDPQPFTHNAKTQAQLDDIRKAFREGYRKYLNDLRAHSYERLDNQTLEEAIAAGIAAAFEQSDKSRGE